MSKVNTKNVVLTEVASVSVGHVFTGKATSEEVHDTVRVVQTSDIRGYCISEIGSLARANLQGKAPKIVLERGDILFTLKGRRLCASIFSPSNGNRITATTQNSIAVIKPNPEQLVPGYLVWYLNSPASTSQLEAMQVGSTIPSISLKKLKMLSVPLVDQHTQDKVSQAYQNWCKQEVLLKNLLEDGKAYVHAFCLTQIHGEKYA